MHVLVILNTPFSEESLEVPMSPYEKWNHSTGPKLIIFNAVREDLTPCSHQPKRIRLQSENWQPREVTARDKY